MIHRLIAAALLASAGLAAPVVLTFDWPAGLTAIVEMERSRSTSGAGNDTNTRTAVRYRLRVEAHPEGRLIVHEGFEPLNAPFGPSARVEELMSSLMPSIIVSKEGDFLRVADLARTRKAMLEMLGEEARDAKELPAKAQQLLDRFSSDEVLTALAAKEWQVLVGTWVGIEGMIGEVFESESEEPFPLSPDLTIVMKHRFGVAERVPCEPGDATDSCVLVRQRSDVTPASMKSLMQTLISALGGAEHVTFERVDVSYEMQATLDPATTRPYAATFTGTFEMSARVQGKTMSTKQIDQQAYRIRYR